MKFLWRLIFSVSIDYKNKENLLYNKPDFIFSGFLLSDGEFRRISDPYLKIGSENYFNWFAPSDLYELQ